LHRSDFFRVHHKVTFELPITLNCLLQQILNTSTGESANWIVGDRWPWLNQKFLNSLQEIEESVKFAQQLREAELGNWDGRVAKAQSEVVERLPNVDMSDATFPCHEIPSLDTNFFGRSQQLDVIQTSLSIKTSLSLCTVIISGLAGVGKSALAMVAAHQCKNMLPRQYDAIFWLNAENADVLRESFTKIALRLLLRGASDKSDKDRNFMLVKNWLDKTSMYLLAHTDHLLLFIVC